MHLDRDYWESRYKDDNTGWDMGIVSPPLKVYFDQLQDENIKILIPGAGNGHEVKYLFDNGFQNVTILDLSSHALQKFKNNTPDFPEERIYCQDFFEHTGQYDLIIEQTFFCALAPEWRYKYAKKMKELLRKDGKLIGLLWAKEMNIDSPPFGGDKEEYVALFKDDFKIQIMDNCYNSIAPRSGKELFFCLKPK